MSAKPLVPNEEVPVPAQLPPPYEEVSNNPEHVVVGAGLPVNNESQLRNSINCQVCRQFINLDQKQNNLVVKCRNCGEATPIKAAPPGKKYVRCTCNGLLICKLASTRVGCPRPHCRAIINLAPATDERGVATGVTSSSGLLAQTLSVICGNCGSTFFVNKKSNSNRLAAKCPHCFSLSSIGPQYARFRWGFFITLGIILLAIGISVTVATIEISMRNGGYYVIYVGLILSGVLMLIRGIVYCFMPISTIDSAAGTNSV